MGHPCSYKEIREGKLRMTKVKCPVNLKPMAKWVAEPDPKGVCRECNLGPVVQWYGSELKTKGHKKLAKELIDFAKAEDTEPLQLCEKLDKIKDEVEKPLRERLLDFDCAVQAYEPDD